MESIETLAIQRYHNNIKYFKSSQPDVLKMVDTLGMAFDKGAIVPKYDLEYVVNYFDAKEVGSGNFLYANNSDDISSEFSTIVNCEKKNYYYEGVPVYYSKSLTEMTSDKAKGLEGVYPIMNYILENTNETDSMIKIQKFIFLGVALGGHLAKIDVKIQAKEYLIIEDDLELFRLSLFTTDYAALAQKSNLTFAIADDSLLFSKKIGTFLENNFVYNRYLKYAHFPTHSGDKLRDIQNSITSQFFISFPYKIELRKYLRPLEYLNNGYKVLDLSKSIKNELFDSKPVLLITAGPSFHKNIGWLKENHDKFIIVAVSATLKTLYKHQIRPTIVTHIDGFSDSLKHFELFPVTEFLKDVLLILGPFSHGLIKGFVPKENVFYYEEATEYIEAFSGPQVPCVGSSSLLISLILGSKELYLLGLDLGIDQKTGATHSEGHAYNQKHEMSNKDALKDTMSLRENLIKVKGNFESTVYTNLLFKLSIDSLSLQIPLIKQNNQNIYNLNDGAYIETTITKTIKDINTSKLEVLNKNNVLKELKLILQKSSVEVLSSKDMNSLKVRLNFSKKIAKKILKYSKNVNKTNPDAFLSDLLGLVSEIIKVSNRENMNLGLVYYSYFRYILPIVFDLFNTEGLKNKNQHIKKLNAMIEEEMIDIEEIYSKTLSGFISRNC